MRIGVEEAVQQDLAVVRLEELPGGIGALLALGASRMGTPWISPSPGADGSSARDRATVRRAGRRTPSTSRMRSMFEASSRKSSSRRSDSARFEARTGMSMSSRSAGRSAAFSAKSSSRPRSRRIVPRGRALHLDHHAVAVLEPCPVHLADRSGRERLGVDALEDVLPWHLQHCSITATTSSCVSGGTLSCRCESSTTNSCGSKPGRVDKICPSFENVGPGCSSASRRRLARSAVVSKCLERSASRSGR